MCLSWRQEIVENLGGEARYLPREYDIPELGAQVFLLKSRESRYIGFLTEKSLLPINLHPAFEKSLEGKKILVYPFGFEVYQFLLTFFPNLKPQPFDRRPSFGCGDRLGMVSAAQLRALVEFPIFPVLAQQSPRELERTHRTFVEVLLDAAWGILEEGYSGPFGADADHIKDEVYLREARDLGFSIYTLDLSERVNLAAFTKDISVLRRWFEALSPHQKEIFKVYARKRYVLAQEVTINLSEDQFLRVFLAYLPAVEEIERFFAVLQESASSFSLEISLDESHLVTSPEAHFFVASELYRRRINFQSLALRFPGSFEKGIDFVGDVREFISSLHTHTVIQRSLGGYRLSLHSGSDKFSIYSVFAQETGGLFHVKTSGTSWLTALETIAEIDPGLFVQIYQVAYETFEENARVYRISVRREELPRVIDLKGEDGSRLLADPKVRQLLHISYGSVLDSLREELQGVLWKAEDRHYSKVRENIKKHLCALFGKGI